MMNSIYLDLLDFDPGYVDPEEILDCLNGDEDYEEEPEESPYFANIVPFPGIRNILSVETKPGEQKVQIPVKSCNWISAGFLISAEILERYVDSVLYYQYPIAAKIVLSSEEFANYKSLSKNKIDFITHEGLQDVKLLGGQLIYTIRDISGNYILIFGFQEESVEFLASPERGENSRNSTNLIQFPLRIKPNTEDST